MDKLTREKIAAAHRGNRQSAATKKKISRSMAGQSNFEGKKHSTASRDRIRHKRGHDDRIEGRRWIVNPTGETYRRFKKPGSMHFGRKYQRLKEWLAHEGYVII
jgi:hypothetical protein